MMSKEVSKLIKKTGFRLYSMSKKIQENPDLLLENDLCKNCLGRGWYIGDSKWIGNADYGEHECEECNGDGYT